MYVRVRVCMHALHIYLCINMYYHVYNMYVYMNIYVYACVRARAHVCVCVFVCVCVCVCVCVYMYREREREIIHILAQAHTIFTCVKFLSFLVFSLSNRAILLLSS